MTSNELYQKAYRANYKDNDAEKALAVLQPHCCRLSFYCDSNICGAKGMIQSLIIVRHDCRLGGPHSLGRLFWAFSVFLLFTTVDAPGLGAFDWSLYEEKLDCSELPTAGAEEIVVRVDPQEGSFGFPVLVGLKGGEAIWERRFPSAEDVNTAKLEISCKSNVIKLRSQYPGSDGASVQEFSWDGKHLRKLKEWTENASADRVRNAIDQVATGKAKSLDDLDLEIYYPQNEIFKDTVITALSRGHKKASACYVAKKTAEAARRLELMFDLTANLAAMTPFSKWDTRDSDLEKLPSLELWHRAWQSLGLESKDYITALNDYGFFLQEAGLHKKAITVFEKVKEIAPSRTVDYLNLADSQWAVGKKGPAAENYRRYRELMERKALNRLPSRVLERVKDRK